LSNLKCSRISEVTILEAGESRLILHLVRVKIKTSEVFETIQDGECSSSQGNRVPHFLEKRNYVAVLKCQSSVVH
jgi:hypothetical protein